MLLPLSHVLCLIFFFFNDTATTEIYTLSLHDALPISRRWHPVIGTFPICSMPTAARSEEHTSELQSLAYLVCRLLLEKKKIIKLRLLQKKEKNRKNGIAAINYII